MAATLSQLQVVMILLTAIAAVSGTTWGPWPSKFSRKVNKYQMTLYVHVPVIHKPGGELIVAGANGTASSGQSFGTFVVIDGLVTTGPSENSTAVGRLQGFYAIVALEVVHHNNFLFPASLVFSDQKYNGSTVQIFGADLTKQKVRAISVVGGTGAFRLAAGTVDISTYIIDPSSHYILELVFDFYTPTQVY